MKLSSKKRAESPERSRRSMTLIELLISLAIIGLMTGIAFPLFSYYQKRSLVDTDIKNFVQLFNYARALQNNPENFSRIADQNQGYNYVIKFTNINNINRATLYSSANGVIDETYVIDKVDFSESIFITYQDIFTNRSGNNLILSFSGTPPREVVTCSILTTPINCDRFILLSLTPLGGGNIIKTVEILNTNESRSPIRGLQLLSINIY